MKVSLTQLTLLFVSVIVAVPSSSDAADESLCSDEQESAYRVLEAINPEVNWRSLYPDDLCVSGPHGIVCDYPFQGRLHVTELNLGYVSDYSPNPPCSLNNATFSPSIAAFPFLRKLLVYRCFVAETVVLPGYVSSLSSLEELYLLDNPSLAGVFSAKIGGFNRLRRIVIFGTSIGGNLPESVANLSRLEQLVMTRNRFSGQVPRNIGMLKNLKILDLSQNRLSGSLPQSTLGLLSNLLKLDLSFNRIEGKIPESLVRLQKLEFLDISHNRFSNHGIPVFLADMPRLREVYLSGNPLGGQIPEIWDKLGGVLGLGLSGLGLVGSIPRSMGLFLRNVCYLGLDNNMLVGNVPLELGLLESVKEMNLENNRLSGKISLPVEFEGKVKLGGNPDLCVDASERDGPLGMQKVCRKPVVPNALALVVSGESSSSEPSLSLLSLLMCLFSLLVF